MNLRSPLLATSLALTSLLLPGQSPNPVPQNFQTVYPPVAEAAHQIQQALHLAQQQQKRLLLDFGTNPCSSCQVTATFFTENRVHAQIAEHFLVVHVNVGPKAHENNQLAKSYGIDLARGLPALAVLDPSGKVIGTSNEFAKAQNMSANDLLVFLNKYRG